MKRRRILLKVSGESLCAAGGFGFDTEAVHRLVGEIGRGLEDGKSELALVFGGGNFLRGRNLQKQGIDRPTGDSMGMLATVINALAVRSALEKLGLEAQVFSAVPCGAIAEPFVRRECQRHLEKGRVALLAGGTGHPYFTTDTTVALRALELGADVIYKGTKVDGVYSGDPTTDPDAELFDRVTFLDVLQRRLMVMDSTAISLCMDNQLPIRVFNATVVGNVERVLRGEELGTWVGDRDPLA